MAGNVAGQGFGLATGIQEGGFDFKSVAITALSAGLSGPSSGNFLIDAVNGAVSNAVVQGIAVATELQSNFDWAGVAAAGIGAGVGGQVRGLFGGAQAKLNFGQTLAVSSASAITYAATRSLAEGTSFGDNIIASLPSVIGQTVGGMLGDWVSDAFAGSSRTGKAGGMPGANGGAEDLNADLAGPPDLSFGPVGSIDLPADLAGSAYMTPGAPAIAQEPYPLAGHGYPLALSDPATGEIFITGQRLAPDYDLGIDVLTLLNAGWLGRERGGWRLESNANPYEGQIARAYTPWTRLKEAIWGRQRQAYDLWDAGGLGYVAAPVEFVFSPITGPLDFGSSYYRGRAGTVAPFDRQTTDIGLFTLGGARAMPAKLGNVGHVADSAAGRGVYFFDQQALPYIDRADATLGRTGEAHFFMPLEDSAIVTDAASAYRYTGGAPSLERAYISGGDVFGVEFPLNGLSPRLPTAADTALPHFLEGGHTALRLPNGGGYLVNPTREFVVPGGGSIPSGSTLFKIDPNGTRIPIREW
ncbi:hypothetical protein [Sphingomonas gilva]|uniref:hypothetical protein n=1 Tax=Sphingomonas gilva TaxID=2305907 RepID=UPI001CA41E45|nr:hypothetical protein [Sphingomonas gilva]